MSSVRVRRGGEAAAPAAQQEKQQQQKEMPRRAEDIAPEIPWLDNLLTGIFFLTVPLMLWTFWQKDPEMIIYFSVALVGASLCIVAVKFTSGFVGQWVDVNRQLRKPTNLDKFRDQAWQLFIHVTMTTVAYFVIKDEPWFQDSDYCFKEPYLLDDYPLSTRLLYATALGIWVYTSISHRFLQKKHKDYFVMYSHHVVTILLLTLSYRYSQTRIGVLVAFIHDASDIPVDLLKVTNYLKWEGPKFLFCVESVFAINLGSWVFFRFFWFYQIIKSAVVSIPVLATIREEQAPFWILLVALLMALFVMHIYWFWLFLNLLYRIITQGAHAAGQHEYEGISGSEADDDGLSKDR